MDDGKCHCSGFSEIQRINTDNRITNKNDSAGDLNIPKRVHPVVYVLVTSNLITYKDLKDNCTIDEMLDLYEICLTNIYNKSMAFKK